MAAPKAANQKVDAEAPADKKKGKKVDKKVEDENFNYIVRMANTDIDGLKYVVIGLQSIKLLPCCFQRRFQLFQLVFCPCRKRRKQFSRKPALPSYDLYRLGLIIGNFLLFVAHLQREDSAPCRKQIDILLLLR